MVTELTCPVMPVITATFRSFFGSPFTAELTLACSQHWAISVRLDVYSLRPNRATKPVCVFTVTVPTTLLSIRKPNYTPLQSAVRSRKRRGYQPMRREQVGAAKEASIKMAASVWGLEVFRHSAPWRVEGERRLSVVAPTGFPCGYLSLRSLFQKMFWI